jgi:CBS domain-containing protein
VLIEHILQRKGTDVVTVTADATVTAALAALREHNIGALVVVGEPDETIVGIMSERDVVRAIAADGPAIVSRPVRDLMSTDLATCGPRATVDEVMKLMTERRIRHIPVVRDGALAGMISIGDVVKSRIGELEDETQTLHNYLAGRG